MEKKKKIESTGRDPRNPIGGNFQPRRAFQPILPPPPPLPQLQLAQPMLQYNFRQGLRNIPPFQQQRVQRPPQMIPSNHLVNIRRPPPSQTIKTDDEKKKKKKKSIGSKRKRKIGKERKQIPTKRRKVTVARKKRRVRRFHNLYNHFNVYMNVDSKLPWEVNTVDHVKFPKIQQRELFEKLFIPSSSNIFFRFGYEENVKDEDEKTFSLPKFPSLYTNQTAIKDKVALLNCGHSTKTIIHRILTIPVSRKTNDNYVFVCTQPRHNRVTLTQPISEKNVKERVEMSTSLPLQIYHLKSDLSISLRFLIDHSHGFIQDLSWFPFKCPEYVGILFIAFSDGYIGTYVISSQHKEHRMKLKDSPGCLFSFQFRNKYGYRVLPSRIQVTFNFRYVIVGAFDGTIHLLKIRPFYKRNISKTNSSKSSLIDMNGSGRLQLVQSIPGHYPYYSTNNSCAIRGLDISPLNPSIFSTVGGDGMMNIWDIRSFGNPITTTRVGRKWGTSIKWGFHTNKIYCCGLEGFVRYYSRSEGIMKCSSNYHKNGIWDIDICRDKGIISELSGFPSALGEKREAGKRERVFCVGSDGSLLKLFKTSKDHHSLFSILKTEVVGNSRDLCFRIGWIESEGNTEDLNIANLKKKREVIVIDEDEDEEEEEEEEGDDDDDENKRIKERITNFLDDKVGLYSIQFQKVLVPGMSDKQILLIGGNYGTILMLKINV